MAAVHGNSMHAKLLPGARRGVREAPDGQRENMWPNGRQHAADKGAPDMGCATGATAKRCTQDCHAGASDKKDRAPNRDADAANPRNGKDRLSPTFHPSI